MPLITIFTPTYNRAKLLPRLYQSLCQQTFRDFEWIVVDDGSTDNTEEVIKSLYSCGLSLETPQRDNDNRRNGSDIKKNKSKDFDIRFFKKTNGGKHTAINMGVKLAKGELFFIADSDDILKPDALEIVSIEYSSIASKSSFAGISGLDMNLENNIIIGSGLPQERIDCNAIEIRYHYHVSGDLKEVFRTSVLKDFPFPEIHGENFCPEQLVWFRIAQKYKLRYINKPIYIADYQEDGITWGITKARMNSPIGSMMTYQELTKYDIPLKDKLKAAVNYWRFRFCAKGDNNPSIDYKWYFAIPFGYLMHLKDIRTTKQ